MSGYTTALIAGLVVVSGFCSRASFAEDLIGDSSDVAVRATSTASSKKAEWKQVKGPLSTRWDKQVSPQKALPEYPRPQMARSAWQNLNGLWDYGFTDKAAATPPASYDGQLLVPYPLESALSGVKKASVPNQRLWYRRTFTIPTGWNGKKILLHFGAVNWDSAVFLNGRQIGTHRGGYDKFDFDITTELKPGENELVVSAWNPLYADDVRGQVLGKQRLHPGGIFYTAATGIWQTVWIEPVPTSHIESIKITPDIDAGTIKVTAQIQGSLIDTALSVTVMDGTKRITDINLKLGAEMPITIPNPHPWTPGDPHLYGLKVRLIQESNVIDSVDSYFAMRKISLGKDDKGQTRIMLNNKFVFQIGALDQGYWPDGIYTAPTDEALRYDIEIAKKLGYNLLRKHAKVEPERWYYWTDKLGMLVWQDMPQSFGGRNGALEDEAKKQWEIEWRREIAGLYNHPSIIVWTTFNEGWGQHDTAEIVNLTRQLDPTRLVNNASGWNDEHVGDMADTHDYPGPGSGKPEPTRAAVNGEFGGVTMRIPDHMWTTNVFGYGSTLKNGWQVTKRYQQLLDKAYKLRDTQGTSAFVYTQLTDVEQESNGILTYDRALIKPDVNIITAANKGKFLPLPPNPSATTDILPTSQDDAQIWRYTTGKPADNWEKSGFDDSTWKSGKAGFGQGVGAVHTSWTTDDIWLRREVTFPAILPGKLAFSVFHDEDVEIYVNGVLAASAKGYVSDYVNLPMNAAGRAAIKPGKNLTAVHCHQTIGGQYIDVGIIKAIAVGR